MQWREFWNRGLRQSFHQPVMLRAGRNEVLVVAEFTRIQTFSELWRVQLPHSCPREELKSPRQASPGSLLATARLIRKSLKSEIIRPKIKDHEMRNSLRIPFPVLMLLLLLARPVVANDADDAARKLVEEVVATAGGEEKLLKLFRFRERVLITSTPAAPVKPDEKENRTSVVQVSGNWWVGTAKRDKDKVRVLCWTWSLRILLEPKSKIQTLSDVTVADKPAFGLRVTESVKEPIDLFFDKESKRLVAIDYTDTRHIFSDWKKTAEGHHYPSHVVGYRFADRAAGKLQDQQWYQTDLLELTPLTELPAELKP